MNQDPGDPCEYGHGCACATELQIQRDEATDALDETLAALQRVLPFIEDVLAGKAGGCDDPVCSQVGTPCCPSHQALFTTRRALAIAFDHHRPEPEGYDSAVAVARDALEFTPRLGCPPRADLEQAAEAVLRSLRDRGFEISRRKLDDQPVTTPTGATA